VIVRLPWASRDPDDVFADEEDGLQFPDMINRGIAEAAQRRGFDILVWSVGLDEHDPGGRTLALARKSDGIILHDRLLDPAQVESLGHRADPPPELRLRLRSAARMTAGPQARRLRGHRVVPVVCG
jgi:LacI family transcriptional regulator